MADRVMKINFKMDKQSNKINSRTRLFNNKKEFMIRNSYPGLLFRDIINR